MHIARYSGVGSFQYHNGTAFEVIGSMIVDTWYHHAITFDCKAGVKGNGTWIVKYENGTEVCRVDFDFDNSLNAIDKIFLTTHFASSTFQMLYDGFGFDWDLGYNIGDNSKEGLLLSYHSPTPLDWTAYSLDEGTNITIRTNTTIPMPAPGKHTVQIFANDSVGNYYKSAVRTFKNYIPALPSISTPNNFSFDYGATGHSIIWDVSDPDPANYTVYHNGSVFQDGPLNTKVTVPLEGLEEGKHNFTCVVRNFDDFQASDEVWVTVKAATTDPPTTTTTTKTTTIDLTPGYTMELVMVLLLMVSMIVKQKGKRRTK
jgi:hypothetical protein